MAVIGFTSKLELDGGSGSFSLIDETAMITVPGMPVTAIEATHLGISASTPYKRYLPGLIEPGELNFESNYTKATYNQLQSVKGKLKNGSPSIPPAGTDILWRVTLPDENGSGSGDALSFTWNGFLSAMELNVGVEEVVKIKGNVKLNGPVTIA